MNSVISHVSAQPLGPVGEEGIQISGHKQVETEPQIVVESVKVADQKVEKNGGEEGNVKSIEDSIAK